MIIHEIFKNFIIKNTIYNGIDFCLVYNEKTYIENTLQKIIDKVISEEDFFKNIQ